MTRMFPRAFQRQEVLPVDHYPVELFQILRGDLAAVGAIRWW